MKLDPLHFLNTPNAFKVKVFVFAVPQNAFVFTFCITCPHLVQVLDLFRKNHYGRKGQVEVFETGSPNLWFLVNVVKYKQYILGIAEEINSTKT